MSSHKPRNRWTEWEWNPHYSCYSRQKKSSSSKAVDGYEWEYKYETEPRTTPAQPAYNKQSDDAQIQEHESAGDNYTLDPLQAGEDEPGRSSFPDPNDTSPVAPVADYDTVTNPVASSAYPEAGITPPAHPVGDYSAIPDQPEHSSFQNTSHIDPNAGYFASTEQEAAPIYYPAANPPPPTHPARDHGSSTRPRAGSKNASRSYPTANANTNANVSAHREPSMDYLSQQTGRMSIASVESATGGHIKGRNPARLTERFDKSYKIHKEFEFKRFNVFKVLWSEPQGGNGEGSHDTISIRETRNGPTHEKVRRFVIISPMKGHCLCLPINTYLKQGTMKSGVHAEHHTIVHTSGTPQYIDGEWEKGMRKAPIRITPSTPRDKLEPQSRLNYAKVYTVEYNVKVCFVGKVHLDFRARMVADYNSQHPQLTYGNNTQEADFSQQDVSHTGQWAGYDTGSYGHGTGQSPGGYPGDRTRRHSGEDEEGQSSYPLPSPNAYYQSPDRHSDPIREDEEGGEGRGEESQPQDDFYSSK